MNIVYRPAVITDAVTIEALVNSAYRGDSSRAGWTTEADLLDGTRISAEEVIAQLEAKDSIILLCIQNEEIIGCVHLEKNEQAAYLGMFVVKPALQGAGIGKQFMQTAENLAQSVWGVEKIWMTVISVRAELIAFYERRGYQRTGRFTPFSTDSANGILKTASLEFEELEKILS
jgi:ribosomal protein S18 acetylase RimI-like enzyme